MNQRHIYNKQNEMRERERHGCRIVCKKKKKIVKMNYILDSDIIFTIIGYVINIIKI